MAPEPMHIAEAFGGTLRMLRLRKNLSQERLALESGLDRTFISLLERGQRQPSLGTIFVLAAALETRPSEIVALVEKRYRTS